MKVQFHHYSTELNQSWHINNCEMLGFREFLIFLKIKKNGNLTLHLDGPKH